MLNWNKKERPLPSLLGMGGGAGGFAFGGGIVDLGNTVEIKLWGAGGGSGRWTAGDTGRDGGGGGFVHATYSIEPGTALKLRVGERGKYVANGNSASNPYNGGGDGTYTPNGSGGTGGGMVSLCIGSHSQANCLAVAGGGGAGNYYYGPATWGGGGGGGGPTGAGGDGSVSPTSPTKPANCGSGGSPSYTAHNFIGGDAPGDSNPGCGNGGGGAGYYGGQGGLECSNGNGGGGSSFMAGYPNPGSITTVNGKRIVFVEGEMIGGGNVPGSFSNGYDPGGLNDPWMPQIPGIGKGSTGTGVNGGQGYAQIIVNGTVTNYSVTETEITINL